ncbi:hypothetical protein M9H77_18175 [Catharanthus roseus]|uniref:Uncharacterized protein n=1 Tax=Catharanthus roseus TaxID=4058 RepID=A0ACC0B6Q9_CATRO|nr:hypothetical protein M9H77_18175 [Catharanthus roseus]
MKAIHPVRVMLFWDSEIARDAYGPYFTGVVRKSWTLPTTRIISHNELIQQHSIPITKDINTTNMTEHITVVTQMVSDEPSMLYLPSMTTTIRLTNRTEMMPFLVNMNQMMIMTQKKESYKLL